jgi:hypothetical protein
VEADSKKSLKERARSELEKYVVITAYLWVLFALFSLHKQVVQGHGVSIWQQGVNADRKMTRTILRKSVPMLSR